MRVRACVRVCMRARAQFVLPPTPLWTNAFVRLSVLVPLCGMNFTIFEKFFFVFHHTGRCLFAAMSLSAWHGFLRR